MLEYWRLEYSLLAHVDVILVNRYLCNCTQHPAVVVTTFGIGGRTDINGGASSSFAMMISHGVMVKGVVVQVVKMYYLRSVPLVHFNFLVEVFLAFYRNVIRIL